MRTFTSRQYVLMNLAHTCGGDKLPTWDDRLDYGIALLNMPRDEAMLEAEDLQGFLKTYDALKEDKDLDNFTVGLDATSSCLQLYAILTGCRKTAEATNVISTGICKDAYQICTDNLNTKLGTSFERKPVKYTVMPTFYGSYLEPLKLVGKQNIPAYAEMLQETFPGACQAMQAIQHSWRSDVTYHEWYMPDGFHVVIPVEQVESININIPEWGVSIPYNYTVERATEKGISLAANVIQSIDAYIVRELIRACDFPVWPIHDCFMCKAKDMNRLREAIQRIYYDISKGALLTYIINAIRNTDTYKFTKLEDISSEILHSEYIIC